MLITRPAPPACPTPQVRHQLAKALVERREVASARLHAGEAAKLAQGEVEAQLLGELQRQLAGL